jgi:hypothetical protein
VQDSRFFGQKGLSGSALKRRFNRLLWKAALAGNVSEVFTFSSDMTVGASVHIVASRQHDFPSRHSAAEEALNEIAPNHLPSGIKIFRYLGDPIVQREGTTSGIR